MFPDWVPDLAPNVRSEIEYFETLESAVKQDRLDVFVRFGLGIRPSLNGNTS